MKKTALFSALIMILASCQNTEKYDATGFFEANTVTVSSETGGKIVSFAIEEGDSLTLGQRVGLVDTTLLALQRKQLHSQQLSTEKSSPDIAAQAAALRSQIAHRASSGPSASHAGASAAAAASELAVSSARRYHDKNFSSSRRAAERLIGNGLKVAPRLVEPHGLKLHQAVEDHHLVLALDERERTARNLRNGKTLRRAAPIHNEWFSAIVRPLRGCGRQKTTREHIRQKRMQTYRTDRGPR